MHRSLPAAALLANLSARVFGNKASCAADATNQTTISYSSSEQVIIPLPPSADSKKGGTFTVVYDKRTRNPKYVVERITKESLLCADDEDALKKKKKRKPFHAEISIENDIFRSTPKDYTNVAYDRGHMAPAADFICHPDMRDATFTMANVCPQAPVMNKGFWAKFEAWLRYQLTHGQYEEMIVITGPTYAPLFVNNEWMFINRTIGAFPRLVHVPTHFFKLVVCVKKASPAGAKPTSSAASSNHSSLVVYSGQDGGAHADWWPAEAQPGQSVAVGAFLVPNSDAVDSKTTLSSVAVRIDQLEAIVGYKLVPEALNSKVQQKLDSIVPASRDLSVVLNAQTPGAASELVFSNGRTALLLPRADTSAGTATNSSSSNKSVAVTTTAAATTAVVISQGKSSLSALGLLGVQHLCEQVDCNRPLFGK